MLVSVFNGMERNSNGLLRRKPEASAPEVAGFLRFYNGL
jgi:hypothetical protein